VEANLEATVDKGLVQIKHQTFLAFESRRNWAEEIFLRLRCFRDFRRLTLDNVLSLFEWRWWGQIYLLMLRVWVLGVGVLALLMNVIRR
jgi:hypothetical protein